MDNTKDQKDQNSDDIAQQIKQNDNDRLLGLGHFNEVSEKAKQAIEVIGYEVRNEQMCWAEKRCLDYLKAPGPDDVICARGKQAVLHPGNKRLRALIRMELDNYNKASTKSEKSKIVTMIVRNVRDASPHGGFIKQDSDGLWWEVGDSIAREKVGQIFRDALFVKYKSSTRMKGLKKNCKRCGVIPQLEIPLSLGLDGSRHTNDEDTYAQAVKALAHDHSKRRNDSEPVERRAARPNYARRIQSELRIDSYVSNELPLPTKDIRTNDFRDAATFASLNQLPFPSNMASPIDTNYSSVYLGSLMKSTSNTDTEQWRDGLSRNNSAVRERSISQIVVGRKVKLDLKHSPESLRDFATQQERKMSMGVTATQNLHGSGPQASEDPSILTDEAKDRIEELARTMNVSALRLITTSKMCSEVKDDIDALSQTNSSATASIGAVRRVTYVSDDGQSRLSPVSRAACHEDDETEGSDDASGFDTLLAKAMDEVLPPADPKALQEFSVRKFYQTYMFGGRKAHPSFTYR